MKKPRVAVLGLGQFGRALAQALTRDGCEVLAVDSSAKHVERIRDDVARAAVADVRDAAALRELLASPVDVVIIAIGGSLEASILATFHLLELGVKEVWAEANSDEWAEVLTRVGATRILSPEREMGRRLAQQIANPNLLEFLPLTEGHGVLEVEAPSWTHGKTLAELNLRAAMSLAVIAMRDAEGKVTVVPGGGARVEPGAQLTLVGRDADLARFRERR
jgi:trk system potassium uptake protein TrkA